MRRMAILLALFASTTFLIISAHTMVQAAPLGEVVAQTTRQETVTKERVIIRETMPPTPSTDTEIIVRQAPPPPPPREEVRIAPPSQTHVWVPGHWTWNNAWVWTPGHWETPPERTVTWVPGEWVQRGNELVWRPGYWR
jgi:hypothetical protein